MGGHETPPEPQDQRRGREDGSLGDFSLLFRDRDRDTRPATVDSINFNFPRPTISSSRCHEVEQINDISHSEFCTRELYILSGIYAEWEKLNWKSKIIKQQQFLELSQIVPHQEEGTKKEPAVVIPGESKMLISNLCIELDLLERKTQMIIDLLTSTEEYGGTRKMILTCASAEANTDK